MIKVLLADDHQLVIDGLKALLEHQSDLVIIGQAKNGQEVLDFLKNEQPDLILLDVNMPVLNGIQTTTLIRQQYPQVKVLILTMYKNKTIINGLVRLGARGCILKNTGNGELNEAIRTVAAGGTFFSTEIAVLLTEEKEETVTKENVVLSEREVEILKALANGMTSKEIGQRLFLSIYTVETHRKNINHKLGFSNVAEVTRYAIESGLLD
jgi:DNA-binding NarL/FixJ family response regulator